MDPEACKKLIVEVSEFFSNKLDILVNNAGMQYVASLEDFPDEKWAQVLQLNLSSCFYTTKQGIIISCYYSLTHSLTHSLILSLPFKYYQ
jgi:3-hydroxybutyrate dehydrogenase